jgi:hypothetical protein
VMHGAVSEQASAVRGARWVDVGRRARWVTAALGDPTRDCSDVMRRTSTKRWRRVSPRAWGGDSGMRHSVSTVDETSGEAGGDGRDGRADLPDS